MATVKDIYNAIDSFAPFSRAQDWDNCGILVGSSGLKVDRAIIALDLTRKVIAQAEQWGAQAIITHHPIFLDEDYDCHSKMLAQSLEKSGIALISAHTNLDTAKGGVDDTLADKIGLLNVRPLHIDKESGFVTGRLGDLKRQYTPHELVQYIKQRLNCDRVRYVLGSNNIQRLAVCAGAGSSLICRAAQSGAQALVTGDVKHSAFMAAADFEITLIDAGHLFTERVVLNPLRKRLEALLKDVEFMELDAVENSVKYL